jgi:NAD-dependent histone deacetylase SIR2
MEDKLIQNIKSGKYKNIIICSGAGISTGAGIPDYRSSDGIFEMFSEYNLSDPSDIFSRQFRNEHPEFMQDPKYKNLVENIKNATPTPSHNLARWLAEKGWLKRVYTQNIDGLYSKAGVPEHLVVEFHGNIDNIVLYDDPIPEECLHTLKYDHKDVLFTETGCDLMLVMGTSLQVAPFCGIPNMVRRSCVRVYIDLEPSMINSFGSNGGYYAQNAQTTKFYQKVALQSRWNRDHYKKEYIIDVDCSYFSQAILSPQDDNSD